jgi:hypothetical protein
MKVQKQVADTSEDVETQLPKIFNTCGYYSLTADELT